MDVRVACPAEDEEADWDEEGDEEGGDEAALWLAEAVVADRGLDAVVDVPPVPDDAEDDADGDGEEGQAHFAEVEVVHGDVDEGEGFEEGVKDAVDEGGIDCREGDGGVEEDELEGAP